MSPVREEQSQAAISTQGERRPSSRMVNFGDNLLRIEHRCVHHQIVELSVIENCRKNLDARQMPTQPTSPISPTCRLRSKLKCSHQEFLISLSVKPRS